MFAHWKTPVDGLVINYLRINNNNNNKIIKKKKNKIIPT